MYENDNSLKCIPDFESESASMNKNHKFSNLIDEIYAIWFGVIPQVFTMWK